MRSGPNKVCPSCGAGYEPGVLFCPIDGTPIASARSVSDPGAEHDPYLGLELPGQIQLLSLIGIGSMGRVYRAFQAGVDREVAVKILHRELGANAELVNRFHREARIASRLVHPNVVQVLMTGALPKTNGTSRGEIYLVMEYLDGISLLSALAAAGGSQDEALTLPRALHIALQICDAVGEAHAQGIVHRDLKPENIMLVRRGEDEDFVKVLDFGIARLDWAEPSATQAGLIFGTAKYISPEGAQGKPVGPAADVYAIATILYQCLAGQTPFEGEATMALLLEQINTPPPELRRIPRASYVPAAIAELVMRNLEKNPADRAEDARALRKDLLLAARQSGITLESIMGQPALRMESNQRTKAQELSHSIAHALSNIDRTSEDRTETGMDPPEPRRGARPSSPSRDAMDPSAPPQRTVIAGPLHDDDGGTLAGDGGVASSGRRPGGTLSGDDGPGPQAQVPFHRNRRFEEAGFFGPAVTEAQRPSGSDLAAMSSSEPGHLPRRQISRPILAAFATVALVVIGFVAMKAVRPTSGASADPIEEHVAASERALEQRAWDAPPGKNVKELTDAWLRAAPQDGRALAVRRRAAERIVVDALDRKYAGDVGGALHLARLAIVFDPTVIAGRQLVQELEGAPSIEPATPAPAQSAEPKARPQPRGLPLPKTSATPAPSGAPQPTSSAAPPPSSAKVPAPLPPQPPPLGEDPRSVAPSSSRPWL